MLLSRAFRLGSRQGSSLLQNCQRRGFAEAAVAEQFDWDALSKNVTSDEGKRELSMLRSTFIDFQSRVINVQEAKPIDWAKYEKDVDPEMLKDFKTSFEALKKDLPEFDVQPLLQEAESKYNELFKQADEVVAASRKRISELEQELKETAAAKERLAHATIDEELSADPEIAKEIDEEIRQGDFIA
ncbi:hypothetical protein WJX84_000506 [Apatococcus fuscideae]|uniref:ATP synthase subunit d, mitochondrial n=1 Tax=Apatococcus fuscideae TaxID=2026836 RepID=A0AAW1SY96_9CHLO